MKKYLWGRRCDASAPEGSAQHNSVDRAPETKAGSVFGHCTRERNDTSSSLPGAMQKEIASVCRSAVAAMAPAGTRASNGDPDGSEGLLGRGDKRATAQSGRIAEEAV